MRSTFHCLYTLTGIPVYRILLPLYTGRLQLLLSCWSHAIHLPRTIGRFPIWDRFHHRCLFQLHICSCNLHTHLLHIYYWRVNKKKKTWNHRIMTILISHGPNISLVAPLHLQYSHCQTHSMRSCLFPLYFPIIYTWMWNCSS